MLDRQYKNDIASYVKNRPIIADPKTIMSEF